MPVSLPRPTVLIVEDDEHIRSLLAQVIEASEQYRVIAVDGPETAREAVQIGPCVALLDIMLNGSMSGSNWRWSSTSSIPRFAHRHERQRHDDGNREGVRAGDIRRVSW